MCYAPQNQNAPPTRNSDNKPTYILDPKYFLAITFSAYPLEELMRFYRMNIFTFRPPLSSGNIGTFKDCLLLEQGRDDLLFSLFLSLSTCMHADANNLTSSVSKRKQIKIMFGLFCFPKLQPIH